MADQKASGVYYWSYESPEEDGGDLGGGEGIGGSGEGSITLEQEENYDLTNPCFSGGTFTVGIRAFVSPSDLNFSKNITSGTIGEGVANTESYSEKVTFRMSDSANLKREFSNPTIAWQGPIYGESGGETSPPSVKIEGKRITLSKKVYGNLRISGTVSFIRYLATIPLEAGAPANGEIISGEDYTATVIFTWSGGVADLIIKPPEVSCKGEVNPDDDEFICYKRIYNVDPCTGEVTSTEQSRQACSEIEHKTCSERQD